MIDNPLAPKFSFFGTPVVVSDAVTEGEVWFVPKPIPVDVPTIKIDPEFQVECIARIVRIRKTDA